MNSKKQPIDEAIEALHNLYGKVENLYDRSLMTATMSALSIIYLLLERKRELEKEEPQRHLKVVSKT